MNQKQVLALLARFERQEAIAELEGKREDLSERETAWHRGVAAGYRLTAGMLGREAKVRS